MSAHRGKIGRDISGDQQRKDCEDTENNLFRDRPTLTAPSVPGVEHASNLAYARMIGLAYRVADVFARVDRWIIALYSQFAVAVSERRRTRMLQPSNKIRRETGSTAESNQIGYKIKTAKDFSCTFSNSVCLSALVRLLPGWWER